MRRIFHLFSITAVIALLITACNKVGDLPQYSNGTTPTLSSSVTTIASIAADSSKTAVTFSWTNPKYATDSANYKYVIQIDSAGRNFTKAVSKTVMGAMSATYTAKEINDILLGFGFKFNTPYDVDVRMISSYGNNNEQHIANTIKFKMTAYVTPPKIAPPASKRLFLVGSATAGGWGNPVPTPTQEFGKIDSVTYVGVFTLSAAGEYVVLPVNGDWSNKYSVADKNVTGLNAGGNFGFNLNDNIPGPAAAGTYKITIDFQSGRFTCVPYAGPLLPTNLFIVGDATNGGWNNPVPIPSQQFTRLNSVQFEIPSLAITAGKEYLLLPVNGDWTNKYGVPSKTLTGLSAGGFFGYNAADNFPGPAVAGNYKIELNFGIQDPTIPVTPKAWFKTTKL